MEIVARGRLTEVKFFQRLSVRLRKENVDEHDLETQPYDVDKQVFPVDAFKADWVDEGAWRYSVLRLKVSG